MLAISVFKYLLTFKFELRPYSNTVIAQNKGIQKMSPLALAHLFKAPKQRIKEKDMAQQGRDTQTAVENCQ